MDFLRAMPVDFTVAGRTLEGLALRWNSPYRVSDDGGLKWYHEGWRAGAFSQGLASMGNVFELRSEHSDVRTGRVTFHESGEGLVFTAVADETPIGHKALEAVTEGTTRGVSLRYSSHRQRFGADGVVWRLKGLVRELSLTARPQYVDAGVTLVRSEPTRTVLERARAVLAVDPYTL